MDNRGNSWVLLAVFGLMMLFYMLRRDSGDQDVTVHTIGDDCEFGEVKNVLNVKIK